MPPEGRQGTLPRDLRDLAARSHTALAEVAQALGATGEILRRSEAALETARQQEADARAQLRETEADRQRALDLLARHEARIEIAPVPAPRSDMAAQGYHPLALAAADALRSGQVRMAFLALALTLLALSFAILAVSGVDPHRLLELAR